jgi:transposase InsO family protein
MLNRGDADDEEQTHRHKSQCRRFVWTLVALDEVRELTHQWIVRYNEERPHDALGSLPPVVYRERSKG